MLRQSAVTVLHDTGSHHELKTVDQMYYHLENSGMHRRNSWSCLIPLSRALDVSPLPCFRLLVRISISCRATNERIRSIED
ncbi:hypothetical protein AX14_006541 [Amanita brunnescens Koide BX004]|nr:hypothetical protein AX14_006541 [Amanita brunnescens Koide BX004]